MLSINIEKEYGIKVPYADIINISTVLQLANFIYSNERQESSINESIVLLKREKIKNKNIFLVHEVGGSIEAFIRFCSLVDSNYAYWGIAANKLKGFAPMNFKLEDVAADYIDKIKEIQESGLHYIAGWSLGGVIAYEIVKQLEDAGNHVEMLALFDPVPPQVSYWYEDFIKLKLKKQTKFSQDSEISIIKKIYLNDVYVNKEFSDYEYKHIWEHFVDLPNNEEMNIRLRTYIAEPTDYLNDDFNIYSTQDLVMLFNIRRSFRNAYFEYKPSKGIKAKVNYFAAKESEGLKNYQYWKKYYNGDIELYQIEGNHVSIFKEPYVITFAKIFNKVV